MKKVLVTGAAGAIGIKVIKYLLSEGKYEITALDLRTKSNLKKLRRYRRRINIIYGSINDYVLMDALIKDMDYIIHLAGIMPPLADIKKDLCELIDYQGTETMIKSMNYYNPKCNFIYASSTTIYGKVSIANINTKGKLDKLDYYSHSKLKIEKLITNKVKNYTIIRLPLILTNPNTKSFMYNANINQVTEALTDQDAAYLFINAINKFNELKGNIWNAGGGQTQTDKYGKILLNVLSIYGISFKYIFTRLMIDKNFYTHIYEDSDSLNKILEYRSDSLQSFYMRLKRTSKHRKIARILAKPTIYFLKKKLDK